LIEILLDRVQERLQLFLPERLREAIVARGGIRVTLAPGRTRPKMPANGGCEMPGVKRERDDSVGVLTLDEPETLNAMTPDLLGDLATAIGEINDDPQARALVLTGAGRGFCSGQNLKAAQILGDDIAAGVMKYYWPAFKALRECRVPVVIAVNGVAAGGGFSLAMAGDMIVAARSARASSRCSAASRWSPISVRPGCCRVSSAGSARWN
jgi:hypothetical protein